MGIVEGLVLMGPSELSILEWWVLVLSTWVNCLRFDERTMHNRELSVLERCPAGDVPLYINVCSPFSDPDPMKWFVTRVMICHCVQMATSVLSYFEFPSYQG